LTALSADAGQLLADRSIDDAGGTQAGTGDHDARVGVDGTADARRSPPRRVLAHRGEDVVDAIGGYERNEPALVRHVERVETEEAARSTDRLGNWH
jgi:hypothetical protein